MANWQKILFGAIGAVGAYLLTVPTPTWVPIVGTVLTAAAAGLAGLYTPKPGSGS